jgi:hypothetical protein
MIERALLGSGLGGHGVELCGRCEPLCPFLDDHLSLLEHVHELDADQRALGCLKRLEPQHGASDPFDAAVVLLHHMIQLFHLADDDRRAVHLVVSPNGSGIGLTAIDGDRLGHAVPADGFGEKTLRGWLVPVLGEQEIDGLARMALS